MSEIKLRKSRWYWRIWWFFGYHGLYQINWIYKFMLEKFKTLIKRKPKTKRPKHPFIDMAFKKKVEVYNLIRKTACGHHAWYNSNVGEIRKPIIN